MVMRVDENLRQKGPLIHPYISMEQNPGRRVSAIRSKKEGNIEKPAEHLEFREAVEWKSCR